MRRCWKEDPVNEFWVVLLTLDQELQRMLGHMPLSPDIEVACFAMACRWELHGIIGGLYAPPFGLSYDLLTSPFKERSVDVQRMDSPLFISCRFSVHSPSLSLMLNPFIISSNGIQTMVSRI